MFLNLLFLIQFSCVLSETTGVNFLPKTVSPFLYNVNLNINLQSEYYTGIIEIGINVLENTEKITLHTDQYTHFDKCGIYITNGVDKFKALSTIFNSDNDFLEIIFGSIIESGKWNLSIPFERDYSKSKSGLFIQNYTSKDGVSRKLFATHLQPNYARRVFPCFDEPNMKANFKLSVTHPSKYKAVSNTNIKYKTSRKGRTTTVFHETPTMSTYLFALVVSEFEFSAIKKDGINFGAHFSPGETTNASIALEIVAQSVTELKKLTKIFYPIVKLDFAALPKFGGGMENWGLIIIDDMVLLDKKEGFYYRVVINLICHEVSHQWFGNIITNNWWDHVWMQEGFAVFYAALISDKINPEYDFMDRLILDIQSALYRDSSGTIDDALERHVENKSYISSKFNEISYYKGAAVTRFMDKLFPNFNEAISEYLGSNLFGSVVPEDLFNVLEELSSDELPSGVTVNQVMKSWITLSGIPYLYVNTYMKNGSTTISVTQSKYNDAKSTYKWWIPLTFSTETNQNFNNTKPLLWISDEEQTSIFTLEKVTKGWVIFNNQYMVYCRINYDIANWKKIISYLKGPNYDTISVPNRLQLVSDMKEFANKNIVPQSLYFEFLCYLKHETNEIVIELSKRGFETYNKYFEGTDVMPKYMNFIEDIFGKFSFTIESLGNNTAEKLTDVAITLLRRDPSFNDKFHAITKTIYNKEEYQSIYGLAEELLKDFGEIREEFLQMLYTEVTQNIIDKQNFLEKSYLEAKAWLESKY